MKVLAVVLLAAGAAHADCPVTVVTAPDDFRAAIEDWAHREQTCSSPLEIRVVRTDGGFYLFARDPRGRTRERVVPDAESAGVLVASWLADDSVVVPHVEVDVNVHVDLDPETGAVRDVPEAPPPPSSRPDAPMRVSRTPSIMAGAFGGYNGYAGVYGIRAELEFARAGRWTFDAIGGIDGSQAIVTNNGSLPDMIGTTDYRALVSAGPTFWFGGWSFRPALAFGLLATSAHSDMLSNSMRVTREYDLSLALTRSVGGAWSIVLQPMYIWAPPRDLTRDSANKLSYLAHGTSGLEGDILLGLRRGL